MEFNSRKDVFFSLIIGAVTLLMFYILYAALFLDATPNFWINSFLILMVAGLLFVILSAFFFTKYTVTPTYLEITSGLRKRSIPLDSIRELDMEKTLWTGERYGTALNGVVIKYNKFDEAYVTPSSNEKFVEEIKKYNPELRISHP